MKKEEISPNQVTKLMLTLIMVIALTGMGIYMLYGQDQDPDTTAGSSTEGQEEVTITADEPLSTTNPALMTLDQLKERAIKRFEAKRALPELRRKAAERLAQNGTSGAMGMPQQGMPPMPGGTPNYFGPEPNWAYSPQLTKFVDSLPGLGYANRNNLGQYIPVAVPDKTAYAGCDYYEIGVTDHSEQMHSELGMTKTRGYYQINSADPNVTAKHYLGPLIIANRNTPIRLKFVNNVATGTNGALFLPVDTTVMGAGMGPLGGMEMYPENRAELHLHGIFAPWISDGTPHQWITPAGEPTSYPKGVSMFNVPDMPDPGAGASTYYYPNQQSARFMFYHDHSFGITRLNVYGGEAAGYILRDPVLDDPDAPGSMLSRGVIPADELPLIIQDKTFVDATTITATDPTWNWGSTPGMPMTGDLWFPHVYMPNQNPNSEDGMNAMGRWDYGPWFWPPTTVQYTTLPHPSMAMEAFMDTPVINGTAYPYVELQPKAYRLRILNACNDRYVNLQLYYADTGDGISATATAALAGTQVSAINVTDGGSGYTSAPTVYIYGGGGSGATATATIAGGAVTGITVNTPGTGYASAPTILVGSAKEVKMVRADGLAYDTPYGPYTVEYDGRFGGVPDPRRAGPKMVQIGNEGGILPNPVTLNAPPVPIGYDFGYKTMTLGNVESYNLYMGPAERADVIVDFSAVTPGATLILYNDAPAPLPAGDPRFDFYTNNEDTTANGGTAPTLPGFGPNIRTMMQIRITGTASAPFNFTALDTEIPTAYLATQPAPLVPQVDYPGAYSATANTYAHIHDGSMTFTPTGTSSPITVAFQSKAIVEEFELTYGRMNSQLGTEWWIINNQGQQTNGFAYVDPVTEVLPEGEIQIWKIVHNGVDTHAIHWHLINVQVLNRTDWAGVIKPPDPNELGWKETVKINPLEDTFVAVKSARPSVPFAVPDSVRPLDPTMPIGTVIGTNPWAYTDAPTINEVVNFGWEYVWHCHLLGHEEMDMMRPLSMKVAGGGPFEPDAPISLTAVANGPNEVRLNWVDNATNELMFIVQRSNNGILAFTNIGNVFGNITSYTDLTAGPGTTYAYRVYAYNNAGLSQPSNTVEVTTPGVVTPGAPTSVIAIAGNSQAIVGFVAPAQTGGSPITLYTVTSNPGGITATGNASSIIVTGLTNGTPYNFTVTARNVAGTGPASTPSNTVIPATVPGAPTNVTAIAGVGRATVVFTPPVSDGGDPIVSYTVTSVPGNIVATGTANPITVNGLNAGTAYQFNVKATNTVGTGPASTLSNSVTPTQPTVPGRPTNVRARAGNGRATVTFNWPQNDGGRNITGFRATGRRRNAQGGLIFAGAVTTDVTATGPDSPIEVTGLVNGFYYDFVVEAINEVGTSAASDPSPVVRPLASTAPDKSNNKKCGLLGPEPFVLLGLLMLLKKKRKNIRS
ncbi:MAG: fibronectin type III domain-containing protein [Planctomycetes bacterium]|nr:fibronectin type III domain-containing protein [Planctomycetota bacterium]